MITDSPYGELGSPEELARFQELKAHLPVISERLRSNPAWPHTSVVVPSVSVNQEELAKVEGAAFYEERLLFTLIRLADPAGRAVYVTSQPIHAETLEYYLQHLPGVPLGRALSRLLVLCLYDASPRPLTAKILDRPRVIERIRSWMGPPERAYLTVYNSTILERRLAVELGIPLNSVDPELLWMGTKSGSRKVFAQAGVSLARGVNDLRTRDQVVDALDDLVTGRPTLRKAVLKLNESFAGEGNGVYRFPAELPGGGPERRAALSAGLEELEWPGGRETPDRFFGKLGEMAGIVEEWIEDDEVVSPSVQLRIHPHGELSVLSTHDQVLGGSTGQVYLGCRFPAHADYRALICADAERIGQVLAENGVIGRFGVDFLVTRSEGRPWKSYAVEINLRMGGTTPPFMALEFLARGRFDRESGLYTAEDGQAKYYYATDNLKSPAYRGLLPEDLFDLTVAHGIHFNHSTLKGVIFFMIGALSQYGKVGVTSIGNSREEADRLYRTTVAILDRETGANRDTHGVPRSLFEPSVASME
jgi:hypothetical protein